MIHCQNRVLVLPWLMGASCLCVKQLAIEMHLWVYGCWCTEQEGAMEIIFWFRVNMAPLAKGWIYLSSVSNSLRTDGQIISSHNTTLLRLQVKYGT